MKKDQKKQRRRSSGNAAVKGVARTDFGYSRACSKSQRLRLLSRDPSCFKPFDKIESPLRIWGDIAREIRR